MFAYFAHDGRYRGAEVATTWAMPSGSGEHWATEYERGRPGWPVEVVEVGHVPAAATVLDLGAGTGKLTRLLVRAFQGVIAIEPAEAMRRILERTSPEAETLAGTAQEIPLQDACVDAVFAAQAFHWFDDARSLSEIARVIRPGGAVLVLANVPAGPWRPSISRVEEILMSRVPQGDLGYDPLDLGSPLYFSESLDLSFRRSPFEPRRQARFANPQTLDREGLVSFFASMGWLADLPDADRLPLLNAVRRGLGASEYTRLWETLVRWTRLPFSAASG